MMFNKNIKTGIIMDEVDGIESRKECSATYICNFINYSHNKHLKALKRKDKQTKGKNQKLPKFVLIKIQ